MKSIGIFTLSVFLPTSGLLAPFHSIPNFLQSKELIEQTKCTDVTVLIEYHNHTGELLHLLVEFSKITDRLQHLYFNAPKCFLSKLHLKNADRTQHLYFELKNIFSNTPVDYNMTNF